MSVKFKPLNDRVLVKTAPAEQKTAGGLIIPDTAKEKPLQGEVVAIGNGTAETPMTVKVGDQIVYGQYAGTEIVIEGDKYLMMRESDIFGIIG